MLATFAACLALIAQQPGFERATELTVWPTMRVVPVLAEDRIRGEYFHERGEIHIAGVDRHPRYLQATICHEVYHWVDFTFGITGSTACSEAGAYRINIDIVTQHRDEIIGDLGVADFERRLQSYLRLWAGYWALCDDG